MFVREKRINGYTYLYLVETVREGGRAKQRIIKNLGRKEAVTASGALERLAGSVARYAERAVILSQLDAGNPDGLACTRIGAPLLFGRLWEETGCRAVIEDLLRGRAFEFPLERAVFATVLHRIMVSGSDRACEKWLADYDVPGTDGLGLHHLYRAMAWLGEELPADEQGGATPFSPRTVKDRVEENLFARRRDLFSELSVVFFDTTSLSFTGAGGKSLGKRGYSKDHRPDLMQMIVGVVIDAEGRPVCSEMWPGNTADVTVLVPVIDRLRSRFAIGRVCVVADRGMICAATIAALEARGLEYLLGARERTDKVVRTIVLKDETPSTPLCIQRAGGEETRQGGDGEAAALHRLSQRSRGQEGCGRPSGRRGRARRTAQAGREGADRQRRLPPLPAPHRQGCVRDRHRQAGRGGALRRHLRAAHQHPHHAAPGGAALSRPHPGGAAVPDRQGADAHAADLPLVGRGDPGARVLLVPGARAPQGTGRALPGGGLPARVGRRGARPRSAPGRVDHQGGAPDDPAHARDRGHRPAVQGRPHRPPTQRAQGWRSLIVPVHGTGQGVMLTTARASVSG